jgi:hypothetical protein
MLRWRQRSGNEADKALYGDGVQPTPRDGWTIRTLCSRKFDAHWLAVNDGHSDCQLEIR